MAFGELPMLGPGEAGFRLDRLRDAWNTLRNDALGRGLATPADVPLELADRVGVAYLGWRQWYEEAAASLLDAAAVHVGDEFTRELDEWTTRYRGLCAELAQATGRPCAYGVEALERADIPALSTLMVAGGLGVFTLGLFWVWRVSR